MSAKITGMIFDRYPAGGGEMLLALALADHSHDDGTHIFPSISSLAAKTRQSERTVQYQLRKMEASGWLILVNSGIGGRRSGFDNGGYTRQYRINPQWIKGANIAPLQNTQEKGADFAPFEDGKGANDDIKGCKTAHERVQNDVEKGATAIAPESRATTNKSNQEANNKRSLTAAPVDLPDWLPSEKWSDWVGHRKAIRCPLTPYAEKLSISRLGRLRDSGDEPSDVIDQSIELGYRGLFPLKRDGPAGGGGVRSPPRHAKAAPSKTMKTLEELHETFSYDAEKSSYPALDFGRNFEGIEQIDAA